MKRPYVPPTVEAHGTVDQLTRIFGGPAPSDVLRNGNVIVATGAQSINACAEIRGGWVTDPV